MILPSGSNLVVTLQITGRIRQPALWVPLFRLSSVDLPSLRAAMMFEVFVETRHHYRLPVVVSDP